MNRGVLDWSEAVCWYLSMRRSGFGLLPLLLLLLLPASANAADANVSHEGVDTLYVGSDSIDDVAVSIGAGPKWVFQQGGLPGAALIAAGTNCADVSGGQKTKVECDISGVVKIDLAGADDRLIGGAPGNGMTIDAGAGNDSLTIGSGAVNTINGEGGDDTIEVGGASDQNTIDGGAGEDLILHPAGPNLINGGGNADTVVYQTSGAETFSVTLDDVRNDGLSGAENIHSDIENLTGGPERDRFIGSAAANTLKGGQGNDEIDGGPGQDALDGGEDEDEIHARDGAQDTIDCGFGQDTAMVDLVDTVIKCEVVYYPDLDFDGSGANVDCDDHNAAIRPGATDVPGDGIDQDCAGGDAQAVATGSSSPPRGSLSGSKKSLVRKGSGSASFRCRAPAGDTCSVRGSLTTKAKGKIGSISGKVGGGKTGKLAIHLNATGRQLLEDSRKLPATIRGTVTNEVGDTAPLRATIQLKAPKA